MQSTVGVFCLSDLILSKLVRSDSINNLKMTQLICRPFITLRSGKVLFAYEKGIKAFCFNVDEVKPKKQKTPSKDEASDSNS